MTHTEVVFLDCFAFLSVQKHLQPATEVGEKQRLHSSMTHSVQRYKLETVSSGNLTLTQPPFQECIVVRLQSDRLRCISQLTLTLCKQ